MKINPKVSIVIPVFNGSDFLSEAIDSALNQTYQNKEVLVINDGSSDGGLTNKIATSYGDKVRYFEKKNGGVGSALNLAIKNMTGDYFSWLSHDDLYYENKIESQIQFIDKNSQASQVILYGDYSVFSGHADDLVDKRLPHVLPENFRYFLTVKNVLHGCTLLVPKEAFDRVGCFNEELRTTQDYDLWFKFAKNYAFIHMPNLLVKARQHPNQGSIQMGELAIRECNELLSGFIDDLSESELLISSPNKALPFIYVQIASSMYYRGFYMAAQRATFKVVNNLSGYSKLVQLKCLLLLLWIRLKSVAIPGIRKMYRSFRMRLKNV